MKITNPGGYPIIETKVETLRTRSSAVNLVGQSEHCIARGAGKSIGDGSFNESLILSTLTLDRMIFFDKQLGVFVAEAGVVFADIAKSFAPKGWFLSVTPGTNRITLGGAVAADVHGKNHHVVGSFCNHVLWLDVLTALQGIVRCSPQQNSDLFYATCGGCGLTGIILTVALQMTRVPSMWIKQIGIKTGCLAETLEACEQYSSSTYTVAWIDPRAQGRKMGRGYLMCGDFATSEELDEGRYLPASIKSHTSSFKIPLYFPVPLLDLRVWTEAVNAMYRVKAPGGFKRSIVSIESFFYPLQAIDLRMFGGGHITYQFVLPYSASRDGFFKIYKKIVESNLGSLVSVLKLFGPQKQHPGNISFPMEGYNLGIDFKVSDQMFKLFRELDSMVLDYGGRHYLAKDVCLSPESVRRGYGNSLVEFLNVKAKWDPHNHFRSRQSIRLKLY